MMHGQFMEITLRDSKRLRDSKIVYISLIYSQRWLDACVLSGFI